MKTVRYQISIKGLSTPSGPKFLKWLVGVKQSTRKRNIVSSIWGKWPGEETIGELLDALKDDPHGKDGEE